MTRLRSITDGEPALRAPSTILSAYLSACRSDPQIPHASVLTRASPAPGAGVGMVSTTSFLFRIIAARMSDLLLRRYCIRVDRAPVKLPRSSAITRREKSPARSAYAFAVAFAPAIDRRVSTPRARPVRVVRRLDSAVTRLRECPGRA